MVILGAVIKAYTIINFMIVADEIWNIKNPRPFPSQTYYMMQWEKEDFYSYKIKDEWVLRKYRKTDNDLKRHTRNEYWRKIDLQRVRQKSK